MVTMTTGLLLTLISGQEKNLQTFGSDPRNSPISVGSFSGHKEPLSSRVRSFGRRERRKAECGILV